MLEQKWVKMKCEKDWQAKKKVYTLNWIGAPIERLERSSSKDINYAGRCCAKPFLNCVKSNYNIGIADKKSVFDIQHSSSSSWIGLDWLLSSMNTSLFLSLSLSLSVLSNSPTYDWQKRVQQTEMNLYPVSSKKLSAEKIDSTKWTWSPLPVFCWKDIRSTFGYWPAINFPLAAREKTGDRFRFISTFKSSKKSLMLMPWKRSCCRCYQKVAIHRQEAKDWNKSR